jgi:hypothetical protein
MVVFVRFYHRIRVNEVMAAAYNRRAKSIVVKATYRLNGSTFEAHPQIQIAQDVILLTLWRSDFAMFVQQ